MAPSTCCVGRDHMFPLYRADLCGWRICGPEDGTRLLAHRRLQIANFGPDPLTPPRQQGASKPGHVSEIRWSRRTARRLHHQSKPVGVARHPSRNGRCRGLHVACDHPDSELRGLPGFIDAPASPG